MKIVKELLQAIVSLFFKVVFIFEKPTIDKNLSKTLELYKGEGFTEIFSQIRAWDAPFRHIDNLIPKKASIVDLGSGDGLLSNYLALSSKKRKVFGIELNSDRVKVSPKGLKNTKFKQGSVLTYPIPKADVFILAHVLHHLPGKTYQEKLISKISKLLSQKKKLIILEIDQEPFYKYLFTWLTDAIIVPILFEGRIFNNNFYYRKRKEWQQLLNRNSFDVQMKLVNKGMPFSHVLIEAIKK